MEAAIQSFLTGAPFLFAHFGVTVGMLVVGTAIYMWSTPYNERALIQAGNTAAAISLAGAILGLGIPLAVCMASSANVWDIVIWGVVTLAIQIAIFRLIDLWLRDLARRIEEGEIGTAILLAAVKLAIAAITAAAVSG